MRPDRFFLLAGLLFGLAFLVVTPPFQVPDEPAHFYRSYAISEEDLSGRRLGGGWGAMLPASLWQLDTELRGDLPGHPERKIRPETIRRAFRLPLAEERRVFVDYRTSAQLSCVPYLPQAAAIAVARALGAPPLVLLYAARLVNLLVATALIALALRQLPAFRWLFTLLALTPMAVFLRASLSADAFTTAVAFLLAATAARLAWGENQQDGWQGGWKDVALLTACAAALCLTKPVYAPLAGLAFLIPASRLPGGRRLPSLTVFVAVTAAAFALAVAIGSAMDLPLRLDKVVDRDRQIQDAFADPPRVAGILIRDYRQQGDRYVAQMVGQLGWLDINLPKPFLWGFLLVLGLLVLGEGSRKVEVRPWQRALLGLMAIATLALVSAAQYATWTPYGADFLEGIQGRYLLPLAPAAAWLLHTRRFQLSPAVLSRVLPALSALSCAFALWLVLRRYYGV